MYRPTHLAGAMFVLRILDIFCMQISPRDIENVILRHPGVADVTAVGVADADVNGNEQLVKAVVVLKPEYDDVTSNQLLTYANRNFDTVLLFCMAEAVLSFPPGTKRLLNVIYVY